MRRVALILPCNPGAKRGNYFESRYWRRADKLLREWGLRPYVKLAAVDSIVTVLDPLGDRRRLGAIVLEDEAWRVKGCDLAPKFRKFRESPALYRELVEDVELGVERLRRCGFSEIYAALWVAAYQAALHDAILELAGEWPEWATMVLVPPRPWAGWIAVEYAVRAVRDRRLGSRLLVKRYANEWLKFWSSRRSVLGTRLSYDCLA